MTERQLPAYEGDEAYVFVSYSHADVDLVGADIRWLQEQGFNIWWDEGALPEGIELAIANRQALIRHEMEALDYERKLASVVATRLDRPLPASTRQLV
jgi:hypothetical protein|tara:strand:- start:37426 stop:37719 length:294 start_codon:yes stop_codon:yes gene_type:complete